MQHVLKDVGVFTAHAAVELRRLHVSRTRSQRHLTVRYGVKPRAGVRPSYERPRLREELVPYRRVIVWNVHLGRLAEHSVGLGSASRHAHELSMREPTSTGA